jgi:hypothetical protein
MINTLILNNSKLESSAQGRFVRTFFVLKKIRVYGEIQEIATTLLEARKTEVTSMEVLLRGDTRIRRLPELKEINTFLEEASVPLHATVILMERKLESKGRWNWTYTGPPDDSSQNPGLRDTVMYLYTIPLVSVCVVGLTLNAVNGLVLSQKEMANSTSIILLGLTFCDSLVLITYLWSALYFGLKFVFMVWKFTISEVEFPFLWFSISLEEAQRMENRQSLTLYPLNNTGEFGWWEYEGG